LTTSPTASSVVNSVPTPVTVVVPDTETVPDVEMSVVLDISRELIEVFDVELPRYKLPCPVISPETLTVFALNTHLRTLYT